MSLRLYKLSFLAPVHFGKSSLEDDGFSLHADTLFSALVVEALKKGGQDLCEALVSMARDGHLRITDSFPFVNDAYFLPKPIIAMHSRGPKTVLADEAEETSLKRKKMKTMKYILASEVGAFFDGKFDPEKTEDKLRTVGEPQVYTKASVRTGAETLPWHLGVYKFRDNAGLYFAANGNNDALKVLEDLLSGLGSSGIGGKRSAGMGRFKWERGECNAVKKCLEGTRDTDRHMSLSVCLPQENEMVASLEDASYILLRRSGFVYSETYSTDEPLRKNDLYVFDSGSVFKNKFEGGVYDVGNGGAHPVYRYAIPFFIGVGTGE